MLISGESLTSYVNKYFGPHQQEQIKLKCEAKLLELHKRSRTHLQDFIQFQLQQEIKNYVGNKVLKTFGQDFQRDPRYKRLMLIRQHSSGSSRDLSDCEDWDLNNLVTIITSNMEFFGDDFATNGKYQSQNEQRFKSNLFEIKALRNRFSHSENISCRDQYEGLNNIQKFFEWFKEGKDNAFSVKKQEYLDFMQEHRLKALNSLVEEESLQQVLRCLGQQSQIFEFRGALHIYQEMLDLPNLDLDSFKFIPEQSGSEMKDRYCIQLNSLQQMQEQALNV